MVGSFTTWLQRPLPGLGWLIPSLLQQVRQQHWLQQQQKHARSLSRHAVSGWQPWLHLDAVHCPAWHPFRYEWVGWGRGLVCNKGKWKLVILFLLNNLSRNTIQTHPDTRPMPLIIPPAGTSSSPYSLYAASWDNSRNADLTQINRDEALFKYNSGNYHLVEIMLLLVPAMIVNTGN